MRGFIGREGRSRLQENHKFIGLYRNKHLLPPSGKMLDPLENVRPPVILGNIPLHLGKYRFSLKLNHRAPL